MKTFKDFLESKIKFNPLTPRKKKEGSDKESPMKYNTVGGKKEYEKVNNEMKPKKKKESMGMKFIKRGLW